MKVRYFLLVAVALVMLTGCHRDASALLERAEAYLPSQPDSAEVCLDSIGQPQRLNDAQKAWYGLLRTYVDNRQGKGVRSFSAANIPAGPEPTTITGSALATS